MSECSYNKKRNGAGHDPKTQLKEKRSSVKSMSPVLMQMAARKGNRKVMQMMSSMSAPVMGNRVASLPIQKFEEEKAKINRSRNVLQAMNYDPITNTVKNRPDETQAIKDAKDDAKADVVPKAYKVKAFTAHHKYPWNKIKDDIETAFHAPDNTSSSPVARTSDNENALNGLQNWSGKNIVQKDDFLRSTTDRISTYASKESDFDTWIQEVCWVPSNIFIGPLSDKRLDDPSKRSGGDDFDAHYRLKRRMSLRSDEMRKVFDAGAFSNYTAPIDKGGGAVTPFEDSEWNETEIGEGKSYGPDHFVQPFDPYFEEKVFQYNIDSTDCHSMNYTKAQYKLDISTGLDIDSLDLTYSQIPLVKNAVITVVPVSATLGATTTKKAWSVVLNIDPRTKVENVKAILTKAGGLTKTVDLTAVKLLRRI